MREYNKVNVKSLDSQLNRLKCHVKNQTGLILRMNIKMFEGNNLSHELLLITRQKISLRNAFENNLSGNIKLPKTQIFKINQFGGFLCSLLSKRVGQLMKDSGSIKNNSCCFSKWWRNSKENIWFWRTTNLGAIYLGNTLTRKEAGYGNKEEKGILRAGYGSKKINSTQYFNKFLKYRSIIRMNLDLKEFISWCNKSWWIYRCWNSLDFFLCIK